jgi:hypothetical protein
MMTMFRYRQKCVLVLKNVLPACKVTNYAFAYKYDVLRR